MEQLKWAPYYVHSPIKYSGLYSMESQIKLAVVSVQKGVLIIRNFGYGNQKQLRTNQSNQAVPSVLNFKQFDKSFQKGELALSISRKVSSDNVISQI